MDVYIRTLTSSDFLDGLTPANSAAARRLMAPHASKRDIPKRLAELAANARTGSGEVGYSIFADDDLVGWVIGRPEGNKLKVRLATLPDLPDRQEVLTRGLHVLAGAAAYQGFARHLCVRVHPDDAELLAALTHNGFNPTESCGEHTYCRKL